MNSQRFPLTAMLLPLLALIGATSLQAAATPAITGIPIDDKLTEAKCGGCHTRSSDGLMRRISYVRTTPEVWDQIIKRMIRLNGMSATPVEVRQIVRYLSSNNGLAPEEAQPIFWEAEHRLFRTQEDENGVPQELQKTCNYCHTIGRVLGQRRTREDYEKLANMHMALFPGSEPAVFRPNRLRPAVAELPISLTESTGGGMPALAYPSVSAPPAKYPLDVALDYLSTKQPLITPEWTSWKAVMQPPKLAGTWLVNGYEKGKGRVYGQVIVEATSTPDEFTTKSELHYARSGQVLMRTGRGIVYTGYSWRGRSKDSQSQPSPDPARLAGESREALFVSRDGQSMEGRWFWGGYEEFGVDVQLVRLGSQPIVLGTDLHAVQSPGTAELHIFGGNLPSTIRPSDVNLGPGVTVAKIISSKPSELAVQIAVAASETDALHDVNVKGATAVNAFAVYKHVSYIKVAPDASFARLGGTIAAKQFAQYEAIAFANGPDGLPETADDISLGPVTANWSLEEFISTPKDDDVKFVGSVNDSGLFTPALEGPNPKRQKQANNYPTENWGDVWVDASYQPTGTAQPLKARSYLVVTVPSYIRYDQPEVSQ